MTYANAWNTYDGEAFLGLVTADYQFYDTVGQPADNAEATAAMITTDLPRYDWAVETQGPAQMTGDEYTVHVSQVDGTTSGMGDDQGISVMTLVIRDGAWKIRQHTFVS